MTTAKDIDNRTAADVIEYLEARVDALKRRISELEAQQASCTCTAFLPLANLVEPLKGMAKLTR